LEQAGILLASVQVKVKVRRNTTEDRGGLLKRNDLSTGAKRITMKPQEKLLSVQQLSLKLKIPKPTLRFWEKEFKGILVPFRTQGGQRRYTAEHISIIEEIKKWKKKGMSLVEIKRKLNDNRKLRDDHSDANRMEILANRIAEVVRAEVNSFFHEQGIEKKTLGDMGP
jgi:DNA-binding transcriptional MerR regulator